LPILRSSVVTRPIKIARLFAALDARERPAAVA